MDDGRDSMWPSSDNANTNSETDLFDKLYHAHAKNLNKFVLRYVHSEAVAEDLVQDLFTKLWNNKGNITHVLDMEAYLFRMAKNGALDYLKKIKRIEFVPDEIIRDFKNYNNGLESLILEKEYFAFLKSQLAKLPETSQKVFQLCREQGKSYDEASAELKISKNTVKHHMVATMKILRKNVLDKLKIYAGLRMLLIIFIEKILP